MSPRWGYNLCYENMGSVRVAYDDAISSIDPRASLEQHVHFSYCLNVFELHRSDMSIVGPSYKIVSSVGAARYELLSLFLHGGWYGAVILWKIFRLECYLVRIQQINIFLPKCLCSMVLLLVEDVLDHSLGLGLTYGERSEARLPFKFSHYESLCIDPFG